jgi:dTDP-4-dehydrorhamnose 3,5-epimerase
LQNGGAALPFQFLHRTIPDLVLIETKRFGDQRGFFMETYQYAAFAAAGIPERFVQDNHSHSSRGVLRGLHYQKNPYAQGKLLRVLAGEVFDVAVDIRRGSPTYGQWDGVLLSADNNRQFYIPPGFAHGFYVLSDTADIAYKVTANYHPESERGIRWNDPDIGIDWPITTPTLSERGPIAPFVS